MKNYLDQAQNILLHGYESADRTGVGTIALFGQSLSFPLVDLDFKRKVPLVTTREIPYNSFLHEIIWFISGATDVRYLKNNNVSIWDDWVIPSSAKFVETATPTSQNMTTWLRCVHPMVYKGWMDFQRDRGFPKETVEEVRAWIGQYYPKLVTELKWKLTEGSIGPGAYGSLWRHWEDMRYIQTDQGVLSEHVRRGYRYVCDIPRGSNFAGTVGFDADQDLTVVFRKIDQLRNAINLLKHSPDSRRIIVSAWNPGRLEDAVLPPCHSFFTFNTRLLDNHERGLWLQKVRGIEAPHPEADPAKLTKIFDELGVPKRALHLMLVCRSQDFLVGSVFNIAQYAVLAHMVAHSVNMVAEGISWHGSNVHIYNNQIGDELTDLQLSREPFDNTATLEFVGNKKDADGNVIKRIDQFDIDDFQFENLQIRNYVAHPKINYPIAV